MLKAIRTFLSKLWRRPPQPSSTPTLAVPTKIYPWTCMRCFKAMAIPAGSGEPLCSCEDPITPLFSQINAGPWAERETAA